MAWTPVGASRSRPVGLCDGPFKPPFTRKRDRQAAPFNLEPRRDGRRFPGTMHVELVTPPKATHWESRWLRVKDHDGNVYAIESKS